MSKKVNICLHVKDKLAWSGETKGGCTFKWRNANNVWLCPGIQRWNVLETWQPFYSPSAFPGVRGKRKQGNRRTEMDRPVVQKKKKKSGRSKGAGDKQTNT